MHDTARADLQGLEMDRLVAQAVERWQLGDLLPLQGASGALIYTAGGHRGPVVVRVSPTLETPPYQADYLSAYAGRGVVKLLDRSDDSRTLLLERIRPGTALSELGPNGEDVAITAWVGVVRHLHGATPPGDWPRLEDWYHSLREGSARLPQGLLDQAFPIFESLLESTTRNVLLHADLHFGNVLRRGDEWVAVDPLCALGDPVAEAGRMLVGSWPGLLSEEEPERVIRARVDALSQAFGWSPARILDWAFVLHVCSASWASHGSPIDWHFSALCAYLLHDLRKAYET